VRGEEKRRGETKCAKRKKKKKGPWGSARQGRTGKETSRFSGERGSTQKGFLLSGGEGKGEKEWRRPLCGRGKNEDVKGKRLCSLKIQKKKKRKKEGGGL